MVQGQRGQVLTPTRCAVLGSPVEHSLSPALHRAAYAALGLDWIYESHRVEAAELAGFVAGLDGSWRGLSCTMPLKSAVVALGVPDATVALLGVGNTLVFDGVPSDPATTRVANTDVAGLASALTAAGLGEARSAVILGNGATARSALCALAGLGVRTVDVMARTRDRTDALIALGDRLGVAVASVGLDHSPDPCDVVVSTTPAAAAAGLAGVLVRAAPVVFDVIYDPWPTPLAVAALAAGRVVVNGLDLLAHQAVGQVRLMTGLDVDVEVLLAAGRAALAARS